MSVFLSCTQTEDKAPALPTHTAYNASNVSYGPDSLQRMDVYLPAGRSAQNTKSIVLIHGGGWNGGSKSEFYPYIDSLKKRMPDYAIFNLDYRLVSNGHLFPAQEEDIRAALQFISNKADGYAIGKDNFVLLGFSAGAHLALLQAYKHQQPQVKAVIDFFGPTDLLKMYQDPWHPLVPMALQMVTGTTPQNNRRIYEQSSPAYFVSPQAPSTLILHGGQDPVVDVSQSELLAQQLKKAGVPHELIIYPKERHGWYGSTLTQSFNRVEEFLKTNLQ